MKIISKFKDYYDGIVNSLGIDDYVIYQRTTLENLKIENKEFYFPYFEDDSNNTLKNNWHKKQYRFFLIGFCGKIYPVIKLSNTYYNSLNNSDEYIYDLNRIKEIYDLRYRKLSSWYKKIENWDKYINQTTNQKLLNIFQKNKCSSFIVSHNLDSTYWKSLYSQITDPILQDYQFYKLKDAFTAFTEISIFVAEQLNTEISEFNMSDKQLVVSKGFDPIYGFRKRKDKKD